MENQSASFDRFYRNFHRRLFRYFRVRVSDVRTAEELTQDVFVKAFRSRAAFDPRFEMSGWIFQIAKNTLIDWFRQNRRHGIVHTDVDEAQESAAEPIGGEETPESRLILVDERETLVRRMQTLTSRQKEAVVLRVLHQLSYEEIAQRLELSVVAARGLVHRARTLLAAEFSPGWTQ